MNHPTVEHCHTMADVRRNIDALDEAIVEAAYRAMIAASIDFERGEFTRLRQEA
jgi:hypothetical protein